MKRRTRALIAVASTFLASAVLAAEPVPAPSPSPGNGVSMAERISRWRAQLPQGTGPHRVVRLIEPDFTEHTIYRPADLRRAGRLPVIAFANGACRNTSTEYAAFLSELASHGYLVVAVGRDDDVVFVAQAGGEDAETPAVFQLEGQQDKRVAVHRGDPSGDE